MANDDKILSKIKIGENVYALKDAEGRTLIAAEETRATGVEGGLDSRIKALESKGRFLSTWNAETGKPDTYPETSQLVEGKYNYRSGDYYIVNKVVATAANNLMPDGAYISKEGDVWTVPTKAFSGSTLNLGDQFQYDGTKWVHIASATTVAFANIQGDAEDNANLKGKLDAKEDKDNLKALAYKDAASGSYTPQGTIAVDAITPAGDVTVVLKQDETAATLTKAAYTPAGSITGDAIKDGSINVTIKDAASATAVTDLEYENYTPAGTIAAKAEGGDFAAVKDASFVADADGTQITGSINTPGINLSSASQDVLTGVATAGTLPSFSEGAFTAASIDASKFFNPGNVTFGTFGQGALPTLGSASTGSFATEGMKFSAYDASAEMITFADVTLGAAVTAQGAFNQGSLPTWTGSAFTSASIDVAQGFNGGSKVADTFNSGSMPTFASDSVKIVNGAALDASLAFTGGKFGLSLSKDTALKSVEFTGTSAAVKLTGAKYLKQEISAATFSGTAASLGFAGSEVADFQVTGVKYNQAAVSSASFAGSAITPSAAFTGSAATISVN